MAEFCFPSDLHALIENTAYQANASLEAFILNSEFSWLQKLQWINEHSSLIILIGFGILLIAASLIILSWLRELGAFILRLTGLKKEQLQTGTHPRAPRASESLEAQKDKFDFKTDFKRLQRAKVADVQVRFQRFEEDHDPRPEGCQRPPVKDPAREKAQEEKNKTLGQIFDAVSSI